MTHFNQLTPAEAERLAMLAEECGEVIQIVGKILRHGYDSYHPNDLVPVADGGKVTMMPAMGSVNNRGLLAKELRDVHSVVRAMLRHDLFDYLVHDFLGEVWDRKLQYTHHQEIVE